MPFAEEKSKGRAAFACSSCFMLDGTILCAWLIIVEALICFSLPLYFLAWGLISMLLMLPIALTGEWFAIFNVLITVSGSLGAFALFHVVRFLITGKSEKVVRSRLPLFFAFAESLGLWAVVTNQFREFVVDTALVVLAFMPTVASMHLLWLVRRRLDADLSKSQFVVASSDDQGR